MSLVQIGTMSPFEFISVAASLVLGLALAQILQAFVRLFRGTAYPDPLHNGLH